MSKLIIESSGLVTPAHDPYWDAPITRREVQQAINEMAENDRELTMRADTANIVLNFLMEKQGITRVEVDAWIVQKKTQIAAARAAQVEAAAEATVKES